MYILQKDKIASTMKGKRYRYSVTNTLFYNCSLKICWKITNKSQKSNKIIGHNKLYYFRINP